MYRWAGRRSRRAWQGVCSTSRFSDRSSGRGSPVGGRVSSSLGARAGGTATGAAARAAAPQAAVPRVGAAAPAAAPARAAPAPAPAPRVAAARAAAHLRAQLGRRLPRRAGLGGGGESAQRVILRVDRPRRRQRLGVVLQETVLALGRRVRVLVEGPGEAALGVGAERAARAGVRDLGDRDRAGADGEACGVRASVSAAAAAAAAAAASAARTREDEAALATCGVADGSDDEKRSRAHRQREGHRLIFSIGEIRPLVDVLFATRGRLVRHLLQWPQPSSLL